MFCCDSFLSTGSVAAVLCRRGLLCSRERCLVQPGVMVSLIRMCPLFFWWIWVANLRLELLRKLQFCKLKSILPNFFHQILLE